MTMALKLRANGPIAAEFIAISKVFSFVKDKAVVWIIMKAILNSFLKLVVTSNNAYAKGVCHKNQHAVHSRVSCTFFIV